jgi:flagellar basal-body rod modification protein FlgD
MAVSAIAGAGNTQDQFLQILIAQLQHQDPLEPVAPGDFIAQLASLSTVEGLQSLNASFSEMLALQQLTQGVDLIGKTVEYVPPGGGPNASGVVDSVTVQDGRFVLMVDDNAVGLSQLVSVQA